MLSQFRNTRSLRFAVFCSVLAVPLACNAPADESATSAQNGTDSAATDSGEDAFGADAGDGGEVGSSTDASTCPVTDLGGTFTTSTLGGSNLPYSGPAVVAFSSASQLTLAFGDFGARTAITPGWNSHLLLPIIPVGSSVWLDKTPAGNSYDFCPTEQCGMVPSRFAVRTALKGDLILGASIDELGDTSPITEPVVAKVGAFVCNGPLTGGCTGMQGNTAYYSVEIQGDVSVVIQPGQLGKVPIGGRQYDIGVFAQQDVVQNKPLSCADYRPVSAILVGVVAHDAASLVSALPMGVLPTCMPGTVSVVELDAHVVNANVSAKYEGPVTYSGRVSDSGQEELSFQLAILPGASYRMRPTSAFPDPALGQSFWLQFDLQTAVLRASQNGELLLATSWSFPNDPNSGVSFDPMLGNWLGVGVQAQKNCSYAVDQTSGGITHYLWNVAFAAAPQLVVDNGTVGHLQLGSKSYEVSVSGIDFLSLTLFPSGK